MDDLQGVLHLLSLKEVYRITKIKDRFENSAEHTWAAMILADYFLKKINTQLDEQKVMKLLLYHDLVEIEAGDTSVLDEAGKKTKKQREQKGFEDLLTKIPTELTPEYKALFEEYEKGETIESKFAHAVDKLEPILHVLQDDPSFFKKEGFTEEVLRDLKEKTISEFPVMLEFFNELITYLKEKKYID